MMPLRPVDLQSVLHKASEPARTHAATREQPNPGQHQFLQQLQAQSARRQKMVRQSEDADETKLQPDGRQKKQEGDPKQDDASRRKKKPVIAARDRNRGAYLDIKV